MSLEEAFAPADAKYRAEVLAATWGHLAPVLRKKYTGTIVFGEGDYGSIFILYDRMNVPESPWWYRDLQMFVEGALPASAGSGLYQFTGTYIRFKNGKCKFQGQIEPIEV